MLRSSVSASVALALTLAPIAAQAAPQDIAAPAEVSRTGADIGESEELRGTTMWVVAIIALGLLIWGGIELLGDDEPSSP